MIGYLRNWKCFSINMEIAMSGIIFISLGLSNIWFNNIPNVVMTGFQLGLVSKVACHESWLRYIHGFRPWNWNPINDQFSCFHACSWTAIFFNIPHCSSIRFTHIYSFKRYWKVQNGCLGNFIVHRHRFRWNYPRNRYGKN